MKEHPTLVLQYQKAIEIQVANTLRAFTNPCCGSLQLCGEVALRPVPEPNVEYLTLILVLFFHHAHRFLAVRGELFVNVNSFLQISMRRSVEGAVSCKLRKKVIPDLGNGISSSCLVGTVGPVMTSAVASMSAGVPCCSV